VLPRVPVTEIDVIVTFGCVGVGVGEGVGVVEAEL
jgi:hypothetical protein